VRELKNVVERAVYRSDSSLIHKIVFDPLKSPNMAQESREAEKSTVEPDRLSMEDLWDLPLQEAVRELKRRLLKKALEETKYNQRKAAGILGLTYDQFRGLYRKFFKP
jgi:psp operon transcriptional activator